MQSKVFMLLVAAALGVTACGKNEPKNQPAPGAAPASSAAPAPAPSSGASQTLGGGTGVQSSAAAADSGKSTGEGTNPHQQHADPKEPAQHRDFQEKGDNAGPKNPQSPNAGK